VRQLHQAAGPDRPDQPALDDLGATNLEVRETKHLYLMQRALRDKLEAWIDSKTDWPVLTTSIAKKWLNDGDGLQDRGITRDLHWGIPVKKGDQPWPGMEGKVFYVWFDAPIEYIAGTAEWADANGKGDEAWERWWRTDKGAADVTYYQFMGKDNVPFHTLSFPATILGSGEPWKLVDYLKSFNYLNYDGGQFSTSAGGGCSWIRRCRSCRPTTGAGGFCPMRPESSDSRVHLGEFPDLGQQGPGRRAGQPRQPRDQVRRVEVRRNVPAGGSFGPLETALIADLGARVPTIPFMEAMEVRKAASELARDLGHRQRIPAGRRPLDGGQDRPRTGAGA
jgi:methionyl-tRNA synthetase